MAIKEKKVYSGVENLPEGRASDDITEGCLVLEGGAWKGLYTVGALDALMVHGINFRHSVGISAGALSGLGYQSGQIGWGARIDLIYRHDSRYCGVKAIREERGIMGFRYFYRSMLNDLPINIKRFEDPARTFAVGATNMLTGEITYFEKGKCDIFKAAAASASVPYVTRPVMIDGVPYLDGGCSEKIPFSWARKQDTDKLVVIRTRERSFRRKTGKKYRMAKVMYKEYPRFIKAMEKAEMEFNSVLDKLDAEEAAGDVFVIAPSKEVTVSRFEGDMEKLGELYWLGYKDVEKCIPDLKAYLDRK